jgi:catechol 2,3-dioxygenase-like lactoylglutathione lyase family enzyme
MDDPGVVNHVGLTVSDLDASVSFYTDVVGLQVERRGIRSGGDWFDTLTGNAGAVIDVAMLRSGQLVLQLVHYAAGGNPDVATGHNRVGNLHLCINVDDVVAKHAEIVASGRHRPTPIVELPVPGLRSFYVSDPDGVPVEFLQQTESGTSSP